MSAVQARKLGEEKARAVSLEASLARVLQDFQRERGMQQAGHAAERLAAQADIVALRRLAKARGRALHNVRALAQDLLCGRSELEVFLVTSLRMVRARSPVSSISNYSGEAWMKGNNRRMTSMQPPRAR